MFPTLGLILFCLSEFLLANAQTNSNDLLMTQPFCNHTCGNIFNESRRIPYPFGIGDECSLNFNFNLTCDEEGRQLRLIAGGLNISVHNISISDSTLITSNDAASLCFNSTDESRVSASLDLSGTPFTFNSTENRLFSIGYGVYQAEVSFTTGNKTDIFPVFPNCSASSMEESLSGICEGNIGCSQKEIPKSLKNYTITVNNSTNLNASNDSPCGFAFLGQEDGFRFRGMADLNDSDFGDDARGFPVVLDWAIGNLSCENVNSTSEYGYGGNSTCHDSPSGGYTCSCQQGYEGNPYRPLGCQDVDECQQGLNPCHDTIATCHNTPGSFYCTCPRGYSGDGKTGDCQKSTLFIVLGVGLGAVFLLIGISCLYFGYQRRKLIRMRETFFKKNGGLLLQSRMSSNDNTRTDSTRVFTFEELKKATNGFSEERIIGRGGHGTVYKGVLPDNRVVAIKKAIITDASQIEPFINEVIILTQINHRNIVKLYGCCLETEVPLLVYEFIANGTLFSHITNGGMTWLSWNNRLRIAAEAAGALAYLHSSASIPIIHRDVKSPNILIDENFTAKISDFGASRMVPLDKTQVTTLVQGTLGYLDPEYFHTSQLTEKSDVYSFGVVLAELLTGMKPICMERDIYERSLCTFFVAAMKEKRLYRILDLRVFREGSLDQLQRMGELVKRCLNLCGEDRPSMKVVATELENLRKFNKQPWVNDNKQTSESSASRINEQESDLYAVSLSTFMTMSDTNDKYSMDTAQMLFRLNSPR